MTTWRSSSSLRVGRRSGRELQRQQGRAPRRNGAQAGLNVLLLPWPLRVSSDDFRPLSDSIHERAVEPFGFFEYQPADPFDVGMVDSLLSSASEHVDPVDLVVLPESSVARDQLADLEAVLSRNGVTMLIAGLRDGPTGANELGSNYVHFGASVDGQWWHYRQDKHHRWSLDRSQVQQYHLDDVLDPRVRWWEAMEINKRSLQMIERDDGHAIAALICEDLAQMDQALELLRDVGPTMVVALLLDGPQLASRWTARYASMLADDPGSAVLTLTSYGMVANAWHEDLPPSSVVALWKDNTRGMQEISLDADARGSSLAPIRHRQSAALPMGAPPSTTLSTCDSTRSRNSAPRGRRGPVPSSTDPGGHPCRRPTTLS